MDKKEIINEYNNNLLNEIYKVSYISNDDKYERDVVNVEDIINIINNLKE